MANYALPSSFPLEVWDRLVGLETSAGERCAAFTVLTLAAADLRPQSFATAATVGELADRTRMEPGEFRRAVQLLGKVQAVTVVRRHGGSRLALTIQDRPLRGQPRRFPGEAIVLGDRLFRTGRLTL